MDDLIDLIYEASINVELWPDVLERLSGIADTDGGVLFAAGNGVPQWVASETMREPMAAFVSEGWAARNPRVLTGFANPISGFVTDHDLLTPEQIASDPMYADFLRPQGFGWAVGTAIVPLTGEILVLSLDRHHARGPIPDETKRLLDPLRSHLARASMLSARVGLEKARSTVVGLDLVGLAAAVINAGGRVLAANQRLEAMTDAVSIRAFDRLALRDQQAQAAFAAAIERLPKLGLGNAGVMSFPVRRAAGLPLVAHLVPLVATSREIFRQGDAVLIVAEIGAATVPNASLLMALFDLTAAESRVAHRAATGMALKDVAQALGVSHETVRTHMQSVYAKTGTRGHAELVSLVSAIPRPA